jgi:hypothetical protein
MEDNELNVFFDWLTNNTLRGVGQTKELYILCGESPFKLMALERKIKETFYFACPADKETVEEILNTESITEWVFTTKCNVKKNIAYGN